MCRMSIVRSRAPISPLDLLVSADHSLAKQSCRDRCGETHGDGWGIGWYQAEGPVVTREAAAASASPLFADVARDIRSTIILGHVRNASVGKVSTENTHPFKAGRWLFAHNGTITGFEYLKERILGETDPGANLWRRGDTDSEHAFAWLISRLAREGESPERPIADLEGARRTLAEGVARLDVWCREAAPDEPAKLNFLLTDGVSILATRWRHTLHLLEWPVPPEKPIDGDDRIIVVASEAIDERPWREIPDGSILTVDRALSARLTPI